MLIDPKILPRLEPAVRRVMIVDPNLANARLLAELLKGMGARDTVFDSETRGAMDVARDFEPTLIFVERSGPRLDGEMLARNIRRSDLPCRQAPIVMVTADATATNIKGARDAGVHEFMVKPFAGGDLLRRVVNVATRPRNWVEAVGYVGPDRRRFNSGEYAGPRKRREEVAASGAASQLDQARRIIVAALDQFDRDPDQARRAVLAQTETLKAFAVQNGQSRLAVAAGVLGSAVTPTASAEALRSPAVNLLTLLDEAAKAAA